MKPSTIKIQTGNIRKINPVARALLKKRSAPQVIPNKKKNWKPKIDLE